MAKIMMSATKNAATFENIKVVISRNEMKKTIRLTKFVNSHFVFGLVFASGKLYKKYLFKCIKNAILLTRYKYAIGWYMFANGI